MKYYWLFLICLVSFAAGQVWQCPITRGNVNTAKINSDFGPRRHPRWFHQGIDLAYPKMTPVYPVEVGRAHYVDKREGVVKIWHPFRDPRGRGDSIPSRYIHNDTVFLPFCQRVYVTKDTVIAYVGDRGCPGDVHLHFDFSHPANTPWFSPLLLLPYHNAHPPGPIEFVNLQPNETVFGICTFGNLLDFSKVSIIL